MKNLPSGPRTLSGLILGLGLDRVDILFFWFKKKRIKERVFRKSIEERTGEEKRSC